MPEPLKVSELVAELQSHLAHHGDGPVCAETRAAIADVVRVDADRFTMDEAEPWSVVLVLDESDD